MDKGGETGKKRGFGLIFLIVLLIIFGGTFGFSAYKIATYYSVNNKAEEEFSDLADMLESAITEGEPSGNFKAEEYFDPDFYDMDIEEEPQVTQSSGEEVTKAPEKTEAVTTKKRKKVKKPIDAEATLAGYLELKKAYPELFGWITIEGTVINYPVMHTPDEPEKYLYLSYKGEESKNGTPYLSESCYEGCGNYIVYGHNMKSGAMFSSIAKYRSKSFWEDNKLIRFDTISEIGEYAVIGAFYGDVGDDSDFLYHKYTQLRTKEIFDEYVAQVKSHSRYDTGITAEFGDSLLTLSTCSNRQETERFVVVAKKVRSIILHPEDYDVEYVP